MSKLPTTLKSLSPFPVLGTSFSKLDFVPLDLSVTNHELKAVDVSSSSDLERFIWNHIKAHNAKVAYGGYLEERGIYNRSSHFNKQVATTERNIHLGLDLWIEADAPIYAPLDGVLHSFKDNNNFGDYGPTLILKHHIDGFEFYTLYGHLSLKSLSGKRVGEPITKGQQIATLGTAEVNGDYPPHLHLQIIFKIEDYQGDYPGVCSLQDLEYYKSNCPNPRLFLEGLV
ncbi:MAG: peptidase M23 [Winogradskyella sp.]|nr:peptidoglycan DD-metalloendopeptidase family protein [Winogradskyella sp.]RNC87328.1 MAG: peptidase M23 [Winogradskyella sp.]